MTDYSVSQLSEIEILDDGRCPWRPVRHHFGITSFGVNAFTGSNVGDRIINEHDEADEHEELYVVQQGRARFELEGNEIDAPAGTLRLREAGREADRVRRGARDDADRDRRRPGRGIRAPRL